MRNVTSLCYRLLDCCERVDNSELATGHNCPAEKYLHERPVHLFVSMDSWPEDDYQRKTFSYISLYLDTQERAIAKSRFLLRKEPRRLCDVVQVGSLIISSVLWYGR